MSRENISKYMKGYKRIKSADEINDQAAIRLVTEVLSRTHDDYVSALRKRKKLLSKNKLSQKEKEKLIEANEMVEECEEFYLSKTFIAYTFGAAIPGREVIQRIKKEAGV